MSDTQISGEPTPATNNALYLTPQECQVILKIRKMQFGRVDVSVEHGRPVLIEQHEKTRLT